MRETVYIYGHSDDLIEVEGFIDAEFSAPLDVEGDGVCIEFDNGDTFRLTYDGEWVVDQEGEFHNPYSTVEMYEQGEVEHLNDYTQVAMYQPWNGVDSVGLTE